MSLHKQGDRLINSLNWTELVKPTRLERDEKESDGMHGRFICEPLERGFGTTIGNALRRVLLSSLQGAAFTSVKINNVQHEFTTIHGVLEDVTDIILNLKQVRMAIDTEEPQKLELHVNKKGAVQAGMVQENQHVVVLNPEQHICTLTEDVELDMELEVRTGKGYVPARHDDDVIGVIPLDASFSPIRRVSYEVQAARVGQMTNYDKLILEVWTDGSVKPEDAIAYAAKIIKEQISVFINFDEKVGTDYGMGTTGVMDVNPNLFISIDELELSVRAANCLRSANISIVGELVQRSENEMLKTKNFGRKSLDEIKEHLLALGLDFGMKVDNFDKKYQEWKKQKEQQNEA